MNLKPRTKIEVFYDQPDSFEINVDERGHEWECTTQGLRDYIVGFFLEETDRFIVLIDVEDSKLMLWDKQFVVNCEIIDENQIPCEELLAHSDPAVREYGYKFLNATV